MSGATISPALPHMKEVFSATPHAEFLSKLVLTIPALMIAIFGPLAGLIIDKIGRIRLLSVSLILYAVAGSSGLYLPDLLSILIGRSFLGISVAGIMTVTTTLIGDYFKGNERRDFSGLQSGFMALGGIVYVGLGGVLADIHWRWPFIIYGCALMVLVMNQLWLPEPVKNQIENDGIQKRHAFRINALLVVIYGNAFVSMVIFYMVPVQMAVLSGEFRG